MMKVIVATFAKISGIEIKLVGISIRRAGLLRREVGLIATIRICGKNRVAIIA